MCFHLDVYKYAGLHLAAFPHEMKPLRHKQSGKPMMLFCPKWPRWEIIIEVKKAHLPNRHTQTSLSGRIAFSRKENLQEEVLQHAEPLSQMFCFSSKTSKTVSDTVLLMSILYWRTVRNCKSVSIPAVSSQKEADDKTPLLCQEGELGPKKGKRRSPNYLGFNFYYYHYYVT